MYSAETNRVNLDVAVNQERSRDIAKLVRKLRWIGMEREARELQAVLNRFPPDERGSCVAGPHSTD
jgi:hypothetical protein